MHAKLSVHVNRFHWLRGCYLTSFFACTATKHCKDVCRCSGPDVAREQRMLIDLLWLWTKLVAMIVWVNHQQSTIGPLLIARLFECPQPRCRQISSVSFLSRSPPSRSLMHWITWSLILCSRTLQEFIRIASLTDRQRQKRRRVLYARCTTTARQTPIRLTTRATIAKIDPTAIFIPLKSMIVAIPIDTPMMPIISVITGKTLLSKANRRFEPIFSTKRASRHMPDSIEKMQANVINVRAASSLSQKVVPLSSPDIQSKFVQAERIGLEPHSRHKPAFMTLSSPSCILPLKEKLDRSDASWRLKVCQIILSSLTRLLNRESREKNRVDTYHEAKPLLTA